MGTCIVSSWNPRYGLPMVSTVPRERQTLDKHHLTRPSSAKPKLFRLSRFSRDDEGTPPDAQAVACYDYNNIKQPLILDHKSTEGSYQIRLLFQQRGLDSPWSTTTLLGVARHEGGGSTTLLPTPSMPLRRRQLALHTISTRRCATPPICSHYRAAVVTSIYR